MQAYEHIMTTMIKLSKSTSELKGLSLEENLALMRKYGAYFTYPDSIRALVKLSTNSAFRQPSHMSDGAWMEYIVGEELKGSTEGYPLDKMYIPEGSELKAADGPTKLDTAKAHNQELFSTREGQAIYEHLKQDVNTDELFQGYIATCYIDEKEGNLNPGENYSLYGISTKAGLARFNQTGRIVQMGEFREVVALTQQLTTLELFKKLREIYPNITFGQIQEAIFASYDENYPEAMMNAKIYAVPSQEEQERILHSLTTGDYGYYERVKETLVEKGAFKSVEDINKEVSNLINVTTFLGDGQKDRFSVDERDS